MMEKAVSGIEETMLKVFDDFCAHHKDFTESGKNTRYFEGWKTNSSYKVNKKVIISLNAWAYHRSYWPGTEPRVSDYVVDLERIFAYLDAAPVDVENIHRILRDAQSNLKYKNIEFKYFIVNFYKKGTAHIIFKDERLLKRLNVFASLRKGWLPPSYGKTNFEDMDAEEQRVVLDFGGIEDYRETMQNPSEYVAPILLTIGPAENLEAS